ncbi:MAG TPA: PAS domain S-box protein [Opitutaceae bacterium]|jgi:PAS domain S-box-containing protein
MPLRHLPIQRKLVGFIFLTALIVLLGSNLALLVYEMRSSKQGSELSLRTMADIIASNSTAALIYDDPKLAEEILAGLRAEPDIREAALFDKQGHLYAVYPSGTPAAEFPASPQSDASIFNLQGLTIYHSVIQGTNRVGTLYILSDLRSMYRRLRVYGMVLSGVLVGAAILAYFLSNFLQRQISQPIINLAETAKIVTEQEDYSVRAAKHSGDELGFVTDAFNAMLEQIQLNHAALGESEERFRVVANSAPVLIWIAGPDMLATWFNKSWLSFVGRNLVDQVGSGWIGAIHPDDRRQSLDIMEAAFKAMQDFRIECRLRRHDGEYRWLLNQGTPRYQGGGFAGFIGSCIDITDNKEAEATVRRSELQLRLVTDNASVFLCQIGRDHRFKFVNRAYAARFGLESSEVVGRHLLDLLGQQPYSVVRPKLDAALAGSRQEYEAELDYTSLGTRWIHAVYEPERTESGDIGGVICVLTDITDRKFAAMELERARDEAIRASRAKDDFLAALSHELRTPLNPVLLLATDAANNRDLPLEVQGDFEIIRKNVELEARLIDDLLDLTRIIKGKMVLEYQPVDVHGAMRDAVATIRGEVEARKIRLSIELGDGSPIVRGDPVRLQQVLWNVLKNAVKFTPEGGRITMASEFPPGGDSLVIRITDTGIGLSPNELETVFDAFSQGEHAKGSGSHQFGGLGLGLAISRRMIELQNGRIYAKSAGRNMGSTFVIELPLIARAAPAAEARRPDDRGGTPLMGGAGAAGSCSILLVEDHGPTRQALERLLLRRGYKVLPASSASEAREMAAAEKVDLVISDIGLPDGSGYDLMAELESTYRLKGIALTGYGTESDIARSRATGFVVHLTKPVGMQALDAAIATVAPVAQA